MPRPERILIGNPSRRCRGGAGHLEFSRRLKALERAPVVAAARNDDRSRSRLGQGAVAVDRRRRSPSQACRPSTRSTNIFSSARTAASTITSAHHVCKLTPLSASLLGRRTAIRASYARKIWRNVRLMTAKHIAHLPETFSDYIAISELPAGHYRTVGTSRRQAAPHRQPGLRCQISGPNPSRLPATSSSSGGFRPRKGTFVVRGSRAPGRHHPDLRRRRSDRRRTLPRPILKLVSSDGRIAAGVQAAMRARARAGLPVALVRGTAA